MGSCASKKKSVQLSTPQQQPDSPGKPTVPDFVYLDRGKSSLIKVTQGHFLEIDIDKQLKFRSDSAIGLLLDRTLMVAGGTDSTCW